MPRRILLGITCLLAVTACNRAPKAGPHAAWLQRLPAECDMLGVADAREATRRWQALLAEVEGLPAVTGSAEARALVSEGRGLLDGALAGMRAALGFDPLSELDGVAICLRIPQAAQPLGVLVLAGKFTPESLQRIFPGIPHQAPDSAGVVKLGDEFEAWLDDGLLVLAAPQLAAECRSPREPGRLLQRHPLFGRPSGEGFLLRQSFVPPEWLVKSLAPAAGATPEIGTELLTGLERLEVEVTSGLEVVVTARDDGSAESFEYLLLGMAEGLAAGHRFTRFGGLLALVLDADRLPDLPPGWRAILGDPVALEASLEKLAPVGVAVPAVRRDGRRLRLQAEGRLSELALAGGLLAGIGLPFYFRLPEAVTGQIPAEDIGPERLPGVPGGDR